jgi:AraC-like DNA-binding protein
MERTTRRVALMLDHQWSFKRHAESAHGDRAIAAIARDADFGTIQRRYEVFRRELGISPGPYRKQRQLRGD